MIADQGLFLVPGLRYLYSIIENGPRFGITEDIVGPSGLRDEIKQAADTYRRAKDRDIRMCPGGDFGFAWTGSAPSRPAGWPTSWWWTAIR